METWTLGVTLVPGLFPHPGQVLIHSIHPSQEIVHEFA